MATKKKSQRPPPPTDGKDENLESTLKDEWGLGGLSLYLSIIEKKTPCTLRQQKTSRFLREIIVGRERESIRETNKVAF